MTSMISAIWSRALRTAAPSRHLCRLQQLQGVRMSTALDSSQPGLLILRLLHPMRPSQVVP